MRGQELTVFLAVGNGRRPTFSIYDRCRKIRISVSPEQFRDFLDLAEEKYSKFEEWKIKRDETTQERRRLR